MATVTTTYLDKKFDDHLETILGLMKQGFDEQCRRLDKIKTNIVSLVNTVDRLIKQLEMKPGAV